MPPRGSCEIVSHTNRSAEQVCIGMIHDLRRPMRSEYTASTIGDHSSFKLYG